MATAEAPAPTAPPRRDPSPRLWTDAEFARMQQLDLFAGRDVELIDGTVYERPTGVPFVFTRKEYYALYDNRFFRDQRIQLIGGVVLKEVTRTSPRNATAIGLARDAIEQLFRAEHDVRCRLPLDLSQVSEPHPDVAVVVGSTRDYASEHPKTAILVIEVADSTLDQDTTDKASLYASGGIQDYWVIDLTRDQVLVFRSPKPDEKSPFGQRYATVSAYRRDDKFAPLAAPNARVQVNDLLP